MLAEDVENDGGAVDDLHLHHVFQGAALAGRELGVGDDRVGAQLSHDQRQLCRLALAEIRARVGVWATLKQAVEHNGAGGLGERSKLPQRVLGVLERTVGVHADQDDVFQTQLPVLDLGDVVKLCREPPHPPERRAVFPVELVAIPIVEVVALLLQGRRPPLADADAACGAVGIRENARNSVGPVVDGSLARAGGGLVARRHTVGNHSLQHSAHVR